MWSCEASAFCLCVCVLRFVAHRKLKLKICPTLASELFSFIKFTAQLCVCMALCVALYVSVCRMVFNYTFFLYRIRHKMLYNDQQSCHFDSLVSSQFVNCFRSKTMFDLLSVYIICFSIFFCVLLSASLLMRLIS